MPTSRIPSHAHPNAPVRSHPAGWEPEYFLGVRPAQHPAKAQAALLKARAFAASTTALLVVAVLHLLLTR